jgi:hypothetical protein
MRISTPRLVWGVEPNAVTGRLIHETHKIFDPVPGGTAAPSAPRQDQINEHNARLKETTMNKLALAALATAICAVAPGFVPEAEAGMRIGFGFGHRHLMFRPHYPPPAYRTYDDEDERRIRRYRAARQAKPEKSEKVAKKVVPLVKFADGEGRQFDPTSKVWFDGKSQCWSGKEQFTFKNGDWFYGKREWIEVNGAWKAAAGESPELVSCESVPSFAAKANAVAAKAATPSGKLEKAENADKGATSQPTPVTPGPSKIKTAEGDTSAVAQKPATTPASAECKKYFPSVGQMISVPCDDANNNRN